MTERLSGLAETYAPGVFGRSAAGDPGVRLREIQALRIFQIAAWPETAAETGSWLAELGGAGEAPGPGRSVAWSGGLLLRVEPLKWWVVDAEPGAALEPGIERGVALDLSHSRTVIRVEGRDATELLNRYLAVDLSDGRFPDGALAMGRLDHLAGMVVRRDRGKECGYEIYVQRSFGVSFWLELSDTATQFGVQIEDPEQGGG